MTDRLQQLEQRVHTQNKRITDLEAKYLALLEDLKVVRAELAAKAVTVSAGANNPPVDAVAREYRSQFDHWPGPQR